MLKVYKSIEKLEVFLQNNKDKIFKYQIIVELDTSLNLKIVLNDKKFKNKLNDFISQCDINIYIEDIDKSDYLDDEWLQDKLQNSIDWSFKKRFDSFSYSKYLDIDIPIISFYSYKGGVGRTTTLSLFSNYLSYYHQKKVVVIDFDFEAPGIINFFDIDFLKDSKNGVLEFILDSQVSKDIDFEDYYIPISKEICGDGEIFVIPAGNVFDINNIDSYIEALSRIDINSAETILEKIRHLFNTIKNELYPDIILIDSRTGISDVFGLLVHSISSMVVGFFGNNKQNIPGIGIFLNHLLSDNVSNFAIVHSQINFDYNIIKRFNSFKSIVREVGDSIIELKGQQDYSMGDFNNFFYINKNGYLATIGSNEDDKEEYKYFIQNQLKETSYIELFNSLIELVQLKNNYRSVKNNKQIEKIVDLKKDIITKIYVNYPEPYGDKIEFDSKFMEKRFYFRKCMEDIFSNNKYLIVGGKGTGKTLFYKALEDEVFLQSLKNKANKTNKKIKVINIIDVEDDENKEYKKFFFISKFNQDTIKDKDFFYRRFWKIYILNSIVLESGKLNFKFSFKSKKLNGSSEVEEKEFFESIIYNDEKFKIVDEEFLKLDNYLKKQDIDLYIVFDQLDKVVKPNSWGFGISPLIELARHNVNKRIHYKLFLRRDLINKIMGTNLQSLTTNMIDFEWDKDEIFGFFFKIIFAYTKEEFFEIAQYYIKNLDDYRHIRMGTVSQIKNFLKIKKYNQIPLEDIYIKPLVEIFFGKYVYIGNDEIRKKRFGTSYDWFYKNLQNADGTISLRPFLDLIKIAIEKFKNENAKKEYPILNPMYYTHKYVRKEAVRRHIDDLAKEVGNEDYKLILDFIKETKFPTKFRYRILRNSLYEEFLEFIAKNVNGLTSQTKEDIENVLKNNGVLKVDFISGDKKIAEFAYLYKYYLGLKG